MKRSVGLETSGEATIVTPASSARQAKFAAAGIGPRRFVTRNVLSKTAQRGIPSPRSSAASAFELDGR